jgi:hypothetical protein
MMAVEIAMTATKIMIMNFGKPPTKVMMDGSGESVGEVVFDGMVVVVVKKGC